MLAVTPHNRFSLETLSANQTTLPGSCRAAFIPLPAWPCASARKMPSATQKPALGFAWEETTAPESGPSGPGLPTEEAPQDGRCIASFLEASELCPVSIQTQCPRGRVVWPPPWDGDGSPPSIGIWLGPGALTVLVLQGSEPHPCVGQALSKRPPGPWSPTPPRLRKSNKHNAAHIDRKHFFFF